MTLSTMTFVQGFSLLFMSGAGGVVPGGHRRQRSRASAGCRRGFSGASPPSLLARSLLYRTRFGLRIFAIGANAQSAELSGVRVTRRASPATSSVRSPAPSPASI